MNQKEKNKLAEKDYLEIANSQRTSPYKNVREAFTDTHKHPGDEMGWLRRKGLRCSVCGDDSITWPVLRFCNYDCENVKCFDCQQKINKN